MNKALCYRVIYDPKFGINDINIFEIEYDDSEYDGWGIQESYEIR
jgi:hypothetical protein